MPRPSARIVRSARIAACALGVAAVFGTGCASTHSTYASPGFANIGYASWREDEPAYRLYPGDVLDVAAPSAPELARTVTVQPDGRISLPLIRPVMAADRSIAQLEAELTQAYSSQLVRPQIDVDVKTATPLRVFVGGEVGKPGVYDMPGDITALQAVLMAGGFNNTGQDKNVVIIRRGVDGRPMMRHADLHAAVFQADRTDQVPLRRFDIIYVPRTGIANADLFVLQYLRGLTPVDFSYAATR
ncbi:MAG: polysaccharide biosynthesis/export family protein [Caulobacteraceae bacterium]